MAPAIIANKKKFTAESDNSDSEWSSDTDSSSGSELDLEGKQMEDLRKFFLRYDFFLFFVIQCCII